MTPDASSTSFEVFSDVVDLDPTTRNAAVAQRCAGDEAMREEVESLLAAHDRAAGRFMDHAPLGGAVAEAAVGATTEAATRAPDRDVGRRVGAYRLEEQVGAGGMGTVYRAVRVGDDFDQQAAIKLVRRGMDTDDILDRFERERRVLAGLEHPNIGRLLDGGSTDDGRPYLVMEYVDGAPIDRYCDERRLPIDARLRLFRTVCAAVSLAHRNLVVHRDLKPRNILVTEAGEAKLLDFGIAKVLDPEAAAERDATVTAARRMTPAYASPEQVRGAPVTTSADVYALGVILYELLTGHRPYDVARTDSLDAAICDTPPLRPTTVVGRSRDATEGESGHVDGGVVTPEILAAARRTDPARLRRRLAGDLEQILLKALRKEPERRYASVAELSEDVQRYLDGLPVLAQPDTFAYRLRKLVARRKGAVAAVVTIAVLLVGGIATSTAMYVQADAAREREVRERRMAEETSRFLESLLASIEPHTARDRDVTLVREILDDAAGRVDDELAAWPRIAARMHLTIGRAYDAIAEYDAALHHLEQSVALGRSSSDVDPLARADAHQMLGATLYHVGRYDEADASLETALALRREHAGADASGLARVIALQGRVAQARGEYEPAIALLEEAVRLQRRAGDELQLAASLLALSDMHADMHVTDAALACAEEALEIRQRELGPTHPGTGDAFHAMGWALLRAERYDAAVDYYRRSLDVARAVLEPDHPELATSLNHLAVALNRQGQSDDEVEALYLEALRIFRANFGDEHRDVGTALNNVASFYANAKRYDEAAAYYEEAIAVYRRALRPDHPFVAIVLQNLIELIGRRGDDLAAESHVLAWRRIEAGAFPNGSGNRALVIENAEGAILAARGDLAAAEPILRDSAAQLREAYGDDHRAVRVAERRLEELERARAAARGDTADP